MFNPNNNNAQLLHLWQHLIGGDHQPCSINWNQYGQLTQLQSLSPFLQSHLHHYHHQHQYPMPPLMSFCQNWPYLAMAAAATGSVGQLPFLTGNQWLTSCPFNSLKMSSSYENMVEDLFNTKLRDDCNARLQQWISFPEDSGQHINIDVLMPNGTIVSVNVAQNATFSDIKEEVFELSRRGPMYGALRDQKLYSFFYVDECGAQREIDDEEIRLCDACPIGNLLKIVEHQENSDDIELDEQIGQLIGKSLKEFDALLNPEVNEFRYRMRLLCEEIVKTRQNNSWLDKMRYAYTTSVDSLITSIPEYLLDRLPQDGIITVQVIFDEPKVTIDISVNCQITAEELIKQSIKHFYFQKDNLQYELYLKDLSPTLNTTVNNNLFLDPSQYLLKIHGSLEYLLDNNQLIQYKLIREIILLNQPIKLLAIRRQTIEFEDEPIYSVPATDFRKRSQSVISLGSLIMPNTGTRRRAQVISSWSLDRKLIIKIHSAYLNNQLQFNNDITRVAVMVGIFHGGEMLCDSYMTTPIILADLIRSSPQNPNMEIFDTITWEEDIVFNLKVSDLPRMARIAFTVVGFTGSLSTKKLSQLKQKPIPVAWANINFFDYRGQLWESSTTLSMWLHDNENECVDDTQSVFNPLGTVVPNPNIDQTIFLTISFTKYSDGNNTVIRFPDLQDILHIYPLNKRDEACSALTSSLDNAEHAQFEESSEEKAQNLILIKKISQEDLLHRIEEKHRDLLWRLRFECCYQVPESLCKLLISFKWNNQKMIGEVISLLQIWPKLPPFKALELLDYAYADSSVRKFAIECLKDLSNEDLSQYLLQLVQALKYESYIYNDLVQFLLERAFENQRIGHHLFWLLRSEMYDPAVSVTFGLILEAYCRGAIDHINILSRQMECLNKLKRINVIIRDDRSRENREKKIGWMQEILAQKFYQETFSNVINPLNPVYKLGKLKVEKCKFMDSKMKPLWLVFENYDHTANDIYIIFKNGDDLRQDMLTLQMIRIMDRLWKEAGYDFRMTPYRCISVEHCVGLIEVVLNADTIANIQKEKGAAAIAAFKKGSLLAWLRDHNPDEANLNLAIEEFTLSCAGYCVATYILGVADRHNDNIMVKKNGQMFHIDFGHILGKFKEKFGIRRERVPFVLTNDFVYVITHGGQSSKKSEYFQRFQRYCEEAFIIIRRRGSFLISLFAMMLSTGIPEISSVTDLQYLRETLVLDKSEEEARIHFNNKFMEALKNSWKTSFNWCAHSLAKDNRMNDR